MTDMNTEAALCCMIVSNPAGGERPHAWQRRVNDLIRAQRDTITALRQREATAVAGAIEAAAHLVSATAYTSNGDRRSLEPVAKGFEGQDMHHATIATAIRAMNSDATRAALDRVRAEGMREAANICTAVIREYDVMKPDGKTYEPVKVQKAAKGLVSIARQDIIAAAAKLEGKP